MQTFATEFPIGSSRSAIDFLHAIREWILGSRHTTFTEADLKNISNSDEWTARKPNESIESLIASASNTESAAVRYTKVDGNLEWVTSIAFSKQSTDSWVGIRISCESLHPSTRLPLPKKPVVVRTLIKCLGGGLDGEIQVADTPLILGNDDIEFAGRCISGKANYRLPLVYVSSTYKQGHIVDVNKLASALSGMAHVMVEPNRAFSIRLMSEVDSQNVYGGTIGIYWPDGGGRRSFFLGRGYESSDEIESAVIEEVRNALSNRRPLSRCTWSAVREALSRRSYNLLKEQGSTEIDKYIAAFGGELTAKEAELDDAEKEIHRLEAEIRKYQALNPMQAGLSLRTGKERDLYPGELISIVHDALSDAAGRVPDDSRRKHVLTSIAEANPPVGENISLKERLKALLRDYKTMDAKCRGALEDMGFEVSEDGKHIKVVFEGDDRYTFTLSKSGSDYRGGLNAASDISRLLF
ncbi:hypothetical protein [Candidatus Ferrigenium straubiae]|jgi:hypothetical protein|uniref:hypothetical protein n=1 Tax=Candidatus Ferrigenium straubiae TaxID=2919506 RepID=UPI003F4AB796